MREPSRLWQPFMVVVVVTVLVLLCAQWRLWEAFRTGGGFSQVTKPDVAQISSITGICFPEDTKLIGAELRREMAERILYAKVQFPRRWLADFLKSLPEHLVDSATNAVDRLVHDPRPWWNPEEIRDSASGGYELEGGEVVFVMIGKDHPEYITVFVVWAR